MYAHAPATALTKVVALRVHVDDSTPENGPLPVLPGTHTLGVLSDVQIHDAARRIGRSRHGRAGRRNSHATLIVHASSKVAAAASRRVLHFEYAAEANFEEGVRLRTA